MATCSHLGQAMGTAAALCAARDILPRSLKGDMVRELQQMLLDDGVFLPGVRREMPAVTKTAALNLPAEERAILQNGIDRPRSDEEPNKITLPKGAALTFSYTAPTDVRTLRLQFDLDYTRQSVSPNRKMQWFAQKLHTGRDFVPMKVADTIVKSFSVYADGACVYQTDNNYHSLVKVPIDRTVRELTVRFDDTWGADEIHLFACDLS